MTNIYIAADTGPSGFGVASRGLIRQLVEEKDINLNVRTHFWGWNKKGFIFKGGKSFPDSRFREYLFRNNLVNEEYLIDDVREASKRDNVELTKDLKDNRRVDSEELMIKQFPTGEKEDVWLGIGGQNFAEHTPQDEDIHTILSTDFNLDLVPRKWEHYLDKVDEVWVPSKWVKKAIKKRFRDYRQDIVDKTYIMPYGINMNYEPTEYDCEACPDQHGRGYRGGACLRDDKFTFLVISRFYHIKGVYRTIKAFIEEFRGDEPVRLFFKTTSNQQFQFDPMKSVKAVINELGYPDPPEIGMKVKPFTTNYLYDLMGQSDCFLQLSRAECFGIAQLQAAYCGTPVIYTNWSAQKEVMDENNKGLIPVNDFELERPRPESQAFMYAGSNDFPPDSRWATPSVEAIGKKMREVFEMSKEERNKRGQEAREYVKNNFKWEDKIKDRVKSIKEGDNNE